MFGLSDSTNTPLLYGVFYLFFCIRILKFRSRRSCWGDSALPKTGRIDRIVECFSGAFSGAYPVSGCLEGEAPYVVEPELAALPNFLVPLRSR